MTLSHDQASLLLVDFLYETLPDGEHAAVAAHLATCPACAAEVGGWKQTRATAGAALRGPLDEPPPAHLRAAILAAYERAEQARRAISQRPDRPQLLERPEHEKARVVSPASSARAPAKPSKGGWWEHWRKAWVVPAFAMAAVFCLFAISRKTLFRSPLSEEVARDQVKAWEKAAPAAGPAVAPAIGEAPVAPGSEANEQPASSAPGQQRLAPARDDDRAGTGRAATAAATSAGKRHAGGAERKRGSSSASSGLSSGASSGASSDLLADSPASRKGASQGKKGTAILEGLSRDKAAADPTAGGLAREEEAAAPAKRKFAEPPPAAPRPAARAPAPAIGALAPASKPKAKIASPSVDDDLLDGAGAPSSAEKRPQVAAAPVRAEPAPAPAPPPAAPAAEAAREAEELERKQEASTSFAQREDSVSARRSPGPGSLEDRLKKAERALSARDWSTAARAYRDLVRLFPSDARVPDWKSKALMAERASVGR